MLLFLLSLQLWGQEVVIQSEELTTIEYEQYLLENPRQKSYLQNYSQVTPEQKQTLLQLIKSAQFEFIEGSLIEAQRDFEKIYQMIHAADWKMEQRSAIHYALLRLAQLTQNVNKRQDYLREAFQFDPEIQPGQNLFPPPLIGQFQKVARKVKKKVWPLPALSEKFNRIYINGQLLPSGQSFIESTEGRKRISFISNKFQAIHITTEMKNLKDHKILLQPLASGSCESPHLNEDLKSNHFFALYKNNCLLPTQGRMDTSFLPTMDKKSFSEPKIAHKIQRDNTWLWIGLSALSTFVAWKIVENQNRAQPSPSIQPNEKYISNSASQN